jgi:hypothetical protein
MTEPVSVRYEFSYTTTDPDDPEAPGIQTTFALGAIAQDVVYGIRTGLEGVASITDVVVNEVFEHREEVVLPDTPGTPGVDEVQQVVISGGGNQTNWTLSLDGQTTDPVFVKNPTATTVQAALEALPNIGVGNVAVTVPTSWTWVIAFQGALGQQDVAALEAVIVSGGGTAVVTITTPGAAPAGVVQ